MEVALKDGTRARIRPIRPQDRCRLALAHSNLSPETVYRRFLAPKPRLTGSELRYLTEVDGHDHVALVAVPLEAPDRIVAVARFVRDREDPELAEFAFVVGDPYQGKGLGGHLARVLAAEASRLGVRRLRAVTLSDNVAVRRLIETITEGLASRHTAQGATELVARLAA